MLQLPLEFYENRTVAIRCCSFMNCACNRQNIAMTIEQPKTDKWELLVFGAKGIVMVLNVDNLVHVPMSRLARTSALDLW